MGKNSFLFSVITVVFVSNFVLLGANTIEPGKTTFIFWANAVLLWANRAIFGEYLVKFD